MGLVSPSLPLQARKPCTKAWGLVSLGLASPSRYPCSNARGGGVPYTWDCEISDLWDEFDRYIDGERIMVDCAPDDDTPTIDQTPVLLNQPISTPCIQVVPPITCIGTTPVDTPMQTSGQQSNFDKLIPDNNGPSHKNPLVTRCNVQSMNTEIRINNILECLKSENFGIALLQGTWLRLSDRCSGFDVWQRCGCIAISFGHDGDPRCTSHSGRIRPVTSAACRWCGNDRIASPPITALPCPSG